MNATIYTKCNDLKKICSGFNLVDELHAMLMQLEMEFRTLVSIDARFPILFIVNRLTLSTEIPQSLSSETSSNFVIIYLQCSLPSRPR